MYMIERMIDMGLLTDETWRSEAHRIVASKIALFNPRVTNRDSLTEVVQAIQKIPISEIETVTVNDLAYKYSVPFINLS